MADLTNATRGIEKLNNHNYDYWRLCVEAYLEGQDLWEIVGGIDTTAPTNDNVEAMRKWRIKAGKAMFILRTTVQKELLEHIRDANTPKKRHGIHWLHCSLRQMMPCFSFWRTSLHLSLKVR
ncbi:hypothetical protein AAC387_Pa02g3582 [Persea americana]